MGSLSLNFFKYKTNAQCHIIFIEQCLFPSFNSYLKSKYIVDFAFLKCLSSDIINHWLIPRNINFNCILRMIVGGKLIRKKQPVSIVVSCIVIYLKDISIVMHLPPSYLITRINIVPLIPTSYLSYYHPTR
jgi:hypothetical protein